MGFLVQHPFACLPLKIWHEVFQAGKHVLFNSCGYSHFYDLSSGISTFTIYFFALVQPQKVLKKAQKDGKAASKKTQVSNLKKRGQENFLEKVLY